MLTPAAPCLEMRSVGGRTNCAQVDASEAAIAVSAMIELLMVVHMRVRRQKASRWTTIGRENRVTLSSYDLSSTKGLKA